MSYDNNECPCGGHKQRETMLCSQCLTDLKDHPSLKTFNDLTAPLNARQHAAIILCTLSRGYRRTRRQPQGGTA